MITLALALATLMFIMSALNGIRSERLLTRKHYAPLQSFRHQMACIAWAGLAVATCLAGILASPA